MGTMGYMSPEQVRGLPVDHRSDIFSFGAILYELLSGKKAFKRDTASDTIAAILQGGAAGADAVGAERLARARPHRPALPGEGPGEPVPVGEGRRVRAVGGVGRRRRRSRAARRRRAGAAPAGRPSRRSRPRSSSLGGRRAPPVAAPAGRRGAAAAGVKRVAVLPFENLGAPEDDYFADGIADEIRGKLTSLPGLEVIARGSSTPYKKTTKTPKQIAEELERRLPADGHRALGEGRRREPRPGQPRARRDRDASGRADVEVAAAVRRGADGRLPGAVGHRDEGGAGAGRARSGRARRSGSPRSPRRTSPPTTPSSRARRSRKPWRASDPPSLRKALGFYEQAVALDPGFAQAWARVSSANSLLYANGVPDARSSRSAPGRRPRRPSRSRRTARRDTWRSGHYERTGPQGLRPRPRSSTRRALRLAPDDADLLSAATALAEEESRGGGMRRSEHLRQAERLDPRSVVDRPAARRALLRLRRYPEAREASTAVSLSPGEPQRRSRQGDDLSRRGRSSWGP